MKNLTNIIYLFFSKYKNDHLLKNIDVNYHIEAQAFMFHHYLATKTNYNWDVTFLFKNNRIEDEEFGIKIATLRFHNLLDENLNITIEGEIYLKKELKKIPHFEKIMFEYLEKNKNVDFKKGTCLERINEQKYSTPLSCHYCKSKICLINSHNL